MAGEHSPSFPHTNMHCLAWLLRLGAGFRTWPSSAVVKWRAKNGEMSLKTFQSSDSIAHTSPYCQTCFQNENWSPAQQGNVRAPTSTSKKKGKCFAHNPSYSAYTEPQPEALTLGMGFLKTLGNGRHLAQLLYFSCLLFPLCLAENRQVFHTSTQMILELNHLWTPTALAHGHWNQWDFTYWCRSLSWRAMMYDPSFCLQFTRAYACWRNYRKQQD